ncbi:MAG: glycosyltransferase family 2 protein [Bacteroidetes bacterium]|jgi:glycosyltransferase involved in cell wall biosynthesis|nr:glycosyltransferase family 2 protein [Bacteroidota bacterium]
MILLQSVFTSNNNCPFFSVCIETSNRGRTIYRALASLLNQDVDNFECIIADDCSSDETVAEIERFINSVEYIAKPFPLNLFQNEQKLGGVLNWNSALKYAKGKYIAGLEGDDYYQKGYLKSALNKLNEDDTIGVYATGSQRSLRPIKGLIPSKEYFQYIYQIINIPPPSETIFIRLDKNGVPFKYNVTEYIYAPEMELLLSIAADGWNTFHSSSADVYREPSSSNTNMTWKFFQDKFFLFEKYKKHALIGKKNYEKAFRRQLLIAIRRYLVCSYQEKGKPESIRNGIETVLKSEHTFQFNFYAILFKFLLFLEKYKLFNIYFGLKSKLKSS